MNSFQPVIAKKQQPRGLYSIKPALILLIFTPLVYTQDGDQYRAIEVVTAGMLFIITAPNVSKLSFMIRPDIAYIFAIALVIFIQPAFVPGVDFFYNIKFMLVLLFCFLPTLLLSNWSSLSKVSGVSFATKLLSLLFGISLSSLIFSSVTGIGEVYTEGGSYQHRAFSWMGDSFSPVMVFFLYYYVFRRKFLGIFLSLFCIVAIMQAKMATGMAVFGWVVYLMLFGRWITKFFVVFVTLGGLFLAPLFLEFLSASIHNFDYSLNNRLLSFEAGLAFFWSSPLFGVGANQTFTLITGGLDMTDLSHFERSMAYYEFYQIHNSFLRILAELGLVGVLLFIGFCAAIVRQSQSFLIQAHAAPQSDSRSLLMACALWLISFVLFYQTTGWFEPGNPQLSWIVCFLTLMNLAAPPPSRPKINSHMSGSAYASYFAHRHA